MFHQMREVCNNRRKKGKGDAKMIYFDSILNVNKWNFFFGWYKAILTLPCITFEKLLSWYENWVYDSTSAFLICEVPSFLSQDTRKITKKRKKNAFLSSSMTYGKYFYIHVIMLYTYVYIIWHSISLVVFSDIELWEIKVDCIIKMACFE